MHTNKMGNRFVQPTNEYSLAVNHLKRSMIEVNENTNEFLSDISYQSLKKIVNESDLSNEVRERIHKILDSEEFVNDLPAHCQYKDVHFIDQKCNSSLHITNPYGTYDENTLCFRIDISQ